MSSGMTLISTLWNNFWFVVWIPPFLWAFVLILDAFQTNKIFQDRWDGPIVSSLFFSLPGIFFATLFEFQLPSLELVLLMMTSGAFGSITIFFYFSALKYNDDVVIADSINNIAIVMVPLFGFLLFGMEYNFYNIIAIALAFASALLFTLENPITSMGFRLKSNNSRHFWKAFYLMFISMLFLTLSIVLADKAYHAISFASGFALYSLGHILVGLCIWVACPRLVEQLDPIEKGRLRIGILPLIRHHWRLFALAEIAAVLAIVFFQRAIDLGDPSVATIVESTAPFLVMLVSFVIVISNRFPANAVKEICRSQLHNPVIKIGACLGMLCSLVYTMRYSVF